MDKVVPVTKWPDVEGSIDIIYGPLGSGKTYAATADILSSLERGVVVFATWPINWEGVDERQEIFSVFLGLIGLKRSYRRIDCSNFHYVPIERLMDDTFINEIEKLTDVELYVDEGYAARIFDSYQGTKMGTRQRMAVYGTRHFNRRIIIVAQRPNAIHVSSRAMVNRFFKCERPFARVQKLLHIVLFIKTEYQDMLDESVNEDVPYSTRWYFASKRVMRAYDSKYLRRGAPRLYPPLIEDFRPSYGTLIFLFVSFFKRSAGFSPRARSVPSPYLISLKDGKPPLT